MKITYLWIALLSMILSSVFCNRVLAVSYSDDFSGNLYDNWVSSYGFENTWRINENMQLVGLATKSMESYLYLKDGFDFTDYQVDVDTIKVSGIDQSVLFRVSKNRLDFYMIEFRYKDPLYGLDDGNNIRFYKTVNGQFFLLAEIDVQDISDIVLDQKNNHHVTVSAIGNRYIFTYDSVKILDYKDLNNPLLSGSIGFRNWGGDYEYVTENIFDNLKISTIENNKTKKIFILPGLGASWNEKAMVEKQSVGDNEWAMTPFVKNYDGLTNTLKNAGLVENKDFYVWNYDWRKPVSKIISGFNDFEVSKVNSNDDVYIIGHSLGGLAARNWLQHYDSPNVKKVISLGSPHLGAIKAYEAWNGGKVSDGYGFDSIALNVLLQLHKKNGKSTVESLREYSPSIRDLIPTFSFVKKNNKWLGANELTYVNNYLINENSNNLVSLSKMDYVSGYGIPTKSSITVKERTALDRLMGYWPDGRPDKYIYENSGDGTVLVRSAEFNVAKNDGTIKAVHADLPDAMLTSILEKLELTNVDIGQSGDSNYKNDLVFYLGSPARLEVSCDGGAVNEDKGGFVVIPNLNYKRCISKVIGTTGGTYHLVVGTNNDGKWYYFEDKIGANETKAFNWIMSGKVLVSRGNRSRLFELLIRELVMLINKHPNNINLRMAKLDLEKNNLESFTNSFFNYRKETKDVESNKLLETLELCWQEDNQGKNIQDPGNYLQKLNAIRNNLETVSSERTRRGLSPTQFGMLSKERIEEMISESEVDPSLASGYFIIANRLSSEVW